MPSAGNEREAEPFAVNFGMAEPARLRDAMLGGSDNFTVDRDAAGYLTSSLPGGAEQGRLILEANGAFRRRVVTVLAREYGLGQFLSIGIGIPRGRTTHEVAQQYVPRARVVYTVDDAVVMAHAHELKATGRPNTVDVVHAGLRRPGPLVGSIAALLDLSRPVGVLLTTLTFVPNRDRPAECTAHLMERLAPGSFLVVGQLARDVGRDELSTAVRRHDELAADRQMRPITARTAAELTPFFAGMELLEPGLVTVDRWRPQPSPTAAAADGGGPVPVYGGVGRKPECPE